MCVLLCERKCGGGLWLGRISGPFSFLQMSGMLLFTHTHAHESVVSSTVNTHQVWKWGQSLNSVFIQMHHKPQACHPTSSILIITWTDWILIFIFHALRDSIFSFKNINGLIMLPGRQTVLLWGSRHIHRHNISTIRYDQISAHISHQLLLHTHEILQNCHSSLCF